MKNPHLIVRTTRNGALLGRLTEFRLKQAEHMRDECIAAAQDRYEERVRALLSQNFDANYALRRGEPANERRWPWQRMQHRGIQAPAPALADPYRHALDASYQRRSAMFRPADLLARHGYVQRESNAP